MVNVTEQYIGSASVQRLLVWLVLIGILACYALLVIPTIDRLGIGWDEATDIVIAEAYQTPQGMLQGISWDLSQTRLPMFAVAVIFKLLGASSLLVARSMSVLFGGLTLLGVFIYGKKHFNTAVGLLATALLAINPFFLTFARQAFTESDIYLACTLIWLLIGVSHFQERPSIRWAVLSGILLSLSFSSKATALVILPAVCLSFLLSQFVPEKSHINPRSGGLEAVSARPIWLWSAWAIGFLLIGVSISRFLVEGRYPGILHLLNYGQVCLAWLIMLGWAVQYRNFTASPVALVFYISGWSLLTFVLFPPEHLANSEIIRALISRADEEMTFNLPFMAELLALHTFTIFFKSTPVLGLGLLAGWVISLTEWKQRELTLPLLVGIAYCSALLILPLGQTFYTIPILPIFSLLAAHQLMRLYSKRKIISLGLIVFGLIWWRAEMRQCYPDYHLNGYQWLGARPFFDRSSIGYRSVVFVPLDGIQQSLNWLNTHAESGQTVQLYSAPRYIVDVIAPGRTYQVTDGQTDNLDSKPDYVVIHIGSTIRSGEGSDTPPDDVFVYPYDVDALQMDYEKVFSVQRAFNLEVASVWSRK